MKSASKMRTPLRPMLPPKTPKSRQPSRESLTKDPVQVFCRIRPMQGECEVSCVRVVSPSKVALVPPESAINFKIMNTKETHHVFKHIFDHDSNQQEVYSTVAQPLVESLVKGKNGLLFSYGVTGSGKTFTMTGDKKNRGIMPRCLDVLFKTISDYQAKKYVFKPDRFNGFDVQTEASAALERQAEMNAKLLRLTRQDTDIEIASRASYDVSGLQGLDEDNSFAVFITYVEIYNNSVFDLLEQPQNRIQAPATKTIREDLNGIMYVQNVTELEVKSVEEALAAFHAGQKRKRMGHTLLNAESSRSHCVFTIRVVQAPVDQRGENVVQDRDKIIVSQLSLVDLAGSERTNRTQNTGQRLHEAGNINKSLMTLRNCLEILRENNMIGAFKKVPYRDSKLTHMFKSYFEGEGQVKMIVCVNPRADDYDETAQVMKFAEITQEVQIARQTPSRAHMDNGYTPGRRKAAQMFREAMKQMVDNGKIEAENEMDIDLGLVYKLPSFPDFHLRSENANEVLKELMICLEERIRSRQRLRDDLQARQTNFRSILQSLEEANIRLKTENAAVTATLNQERERLRNYEGKMSRYENVIDSLNRKVRDKETYILKLETELNSLQSQLERKAYEKERQKEKFTLKLVRETEKKERELENKLEAHEQQLKAELNSKEAKLKLMREIMDNEATPAVSSLISRFNNANTENVQPPQSERKARSRAVSSAATNTRSRRSKSVGTEKWIEHRATKNPTQLGTILQPYYNAARRVKSPEMRDITSGPSRYCLITQEADTEGELETKLYKGDVLPTTTGGAQVIFDDVECLKQKEPGSPPPRKRKSSVGAEIQKTPGKLQTSIEMVQSRCSIGIEGGRKKPRK